MQCGPARRHAWLRSQPAAAAAALRPAAQGRFALPRRGVMGAVGARSGAAQQGSFALPPQHAYPRWQGLRILHGVPWKRWAVGCTEKGIAAAACINWWGVPPRFLSRSHMGPHAAYHAGSCQGFLAFPHVLQLITPCPLRQQPRPPPLAEGCRFPAREARPSGPRCAPTNPNLPCPPGNYLLSAVGAGQRGGVAA